MSIDELLNEKVFKYFYELSGIPHGSGNTREVQEYCLDFANQHGFKSHRDACGNVTVYKPATPGYEDRDPVILQGHLDMVCEKSLDCMKDMAMDGLELYTEDGYIRARGTTLGADNGIAVAYMLAILDMEDIKHPAIEALFTIDEEVGLIGANHLDTSVLRGTRLINMDSEEEGILTVSCAGGIRVECSIPITESAAADHAFEITVKGLKGGHSGMEIHNSHRNAAKVLGEVLDHLSFHEKLNIGIASITMGGRLNVIPRSASVTICCSVEDADKVCSAVKEYESIFKNACHEIEPGASIHIVPAEYEGRASDKEGTHRIISALYMYPHGVVAMDPHIRDLVLTSLNIGHAAYGNGTLEIGLMVRSNADYGQNVLGRQLECITEILGGSAHLIAEYPAWEYRNDSPLRDTFISVYEQMYGKPPVVNALHAGLECGVIANKIPGIDCISLGPSMYGVHSPQERLDIESTRRTFRYLLKVLEEL